MEHGESLHLIAACKKASSRDCNNDLLGGFYGSVRPPTLRHLARTFQRDGPPEEIPWKKGFAPRGTTISTPRMVPE